MRGPRIVDIGITVFFFVLAIVAWWQVQGFPFQDKLYPYVASGLIFMSLVIYIAQQIISGPLEMGEDNSADGPGQPFTRENLPTLMRPICAIALLVLAVFMVGHLIAVPGFIFIYILLKGEKLWIAALGAGLMVLFIYGLLMNVMDIPLPYPVLFQWFGWSW